jgi:hypothetical protein
MCDIYTFQHEVRIFLTFSCPYTTIPLFSGVHVNLIHVAPQSLAKTELASRPHYQGAPLSYGYEIIHVREAHKPAIQKVPLQHMQGKFRAELPMSTRS